MQEGEGAHVASSRVAECWTGWSRWARTSWRAQEKLRHRVGGWRHLRTGAWPQWGADGQCGPMGGSDGIGGVAVVVQVTRKCLGVNFLLCSVATATGDTVLGPQSLLPISHWAKRKGSSCRLRSVLRQHAVRG